MSVLSVSLPNSLHTMVKTVASEEAVSYTHLDVYKRQCHT